MALSTISGTTGITDATITSAKLADFAAAVDLNGVELILDADQDTSITADTDDRIDFKIANVEHFSFSNSSGDTIVKPMVDAKDIKFQQFDGRTLLDINDAGFVGIENGATGPGAIRIFEDSDLGSNYVGLSVGNVSTAYTLVFPNADGSSGQALTTNGSGVLSFTTLSANTPSSADGQALGSASLEWSDLFLADASTIQFGNDQDVILTHVADTGLLLSGTNVIQFNDASQNIGAPSATVLDINATDEIELNATLVDINANVEISGTATTTGVHTFTATPVFSSDITVTDDINLISDSAQMTFGANNEITLTHVHDSGLALKHTATADDKPITLVLQTGETDMAANDVIGAINFQAPDEGTGTDAILVAAGIEAIAEGDFSSSNNATKLSFKTGASEAAAEKMSLSSAGLLTVADDLIIKNAGTIGTAADSDLLTMGNAILTVAGEVSMTTLDIGGTNVTSTAAELNILDGVTSTAAELNIIDGNTSATSTTLADADRVVVNDNGTMVQVAMSDVSTYIGGSGMDLISTTSASSSSGVNINGPFTTTYDHYLVTYTITFSADGAKARVRFQNTSNAEQSDTYNQSSLRSNNETAVNGFNNTNYFVLNDNGQSNFSTIPLTGHMYVSGPRVDDARCGFRNFATTSDAGREGGFEISAGHLNENTEISGIKIYPSGGNFASATIKVYGLKKS